MTQLDSLKKYTTVVAEHLYRRLGYPDSIVDTQLSDLETNEYICFKAMDRNICMEQQVEEQDQIWIKRVIPLVGIHREGLMGRFLGLRFVRGRRSLSRSKGGFER